MQDIHEFTRNVNEVTYLPNVESQFPNIETDPLILGKKLETNCSTKHYALSVS